MRRAVVTAGATVLVWATIRFVPPVNRATGRIFWTRIAMPVHCSACGHETIARRKPHLITCPACGHAGYTYNDLSERPAAYVRDWPIASERWEAIHAPCA